MSAAAPTTNQGASLAPAGALCAGLLAIFAAQRVLAAGDTTELVRYAGVGLYLLALGLRARGLSRSTGDARATEGRLLVAYLGVGAGLGLYALGTESGLSLLGLTGESATRMTVGLTGLWLSSMVVSLFAVLFGELVYARMPIPESIELRRVLTALQAGTSLALAMVFLLCVNYVATARDVRKDVSYFRTAEPSASTLAMTAKLDKRLKVVLFFDTGNDVLEQVRPYFEALRKSSKHMTYQVRDVALSPTLATKYKVRGNGNVLLLHGSGDAERGEIFRVGTELTDARATLRKLDGTFQQSFRKLVRPQRMLQLTVGHGERNAKSSDLPGPDGTKVMGEVLGRLNLRSQDLGVGQGLGREIPRGEGAVVVMGPSQEFLPEEAASLLDYVKKGGRLLLALDPGVKTGLEPLLTGLGVQVLPGTVLSDVSMMARAHDKSDRANVFTNNYTSHPAVTTVTRNQREVATVLVSAAGLAPAPGVSEKQAKVTFPVRGGREFWRDLDGDFERNGSEKYETVNLMAAVTVKGEGGVEGRAVIVGDGDFMTDKVAPNHGNYLLFVDALAWLVGNEELGGEVNSEEDVPIEHTTEEDKVWFYLTTFAVPAPIVLLGFYVANRRRRRAEGKAS